MKKFYLLSFALAVLMLGACSSDETVATDDTGGQPQWNADGKGYINLSISLPTAMGTRANDDWNDGEGSEYTVNDATLILFTANGSDAPTIHSAYTMNLNFSTSGTSTDAITSTAKITQEINQVSATTIKALVVLNKNNLFTVSEDAKLMVGSSNMTGKTLDELNEAVRDASTSTTSWHTNGFLMSNALLSTSQGGENAPTQNSAFVLTDITASEIYGTQSEADSNPAAVIYVERAEAKVQVSANQTSGTVSDGSSLNYTINGWIIDNTNNTSKLVRTTDGFNNWCDYYSDKIKTTDADAYSQRYRFVGGTEVGEDIDGTTSLYRVYWGEDFNYTGSYSNAFTSVGENGQASVTSWNNPGSSVYCFENTTDLAGMIDENCTRVIVKATFNNGNGFYTVDEAKSKCWTEADVKTEVGSRLILDPTMNSWINNNLKADQEFESSDFDITLSTPSAGKVTVTSVTLTTSGVNKMQTGYTLPTDIVDLANKHITIEYYEGGAAYYNVSVMHFGDDLTPWNKDDATAGNAYNSESNNYLGRWGVLRNNWYQISIGGIKSLGSPTIEKVTKSPLDEVESYISFSINILPWAIRRQEVTL